MPTLVVFHEVDDVEHWLSSPKREELFGPLDITVRTFVDPEGSTRVGVIVWLAAGAVVGLAVAAWYVLT